MSDLSEALQVIVDISALLYVIASMFAMGLSLTIARPGERMMLWVTGIFYCPFLLTQYLCSIKEEN